MSEMFFRIQYNSEMNAIYSLKMVNQKRVGGLATIHGDDVLAGVAKAIATAWGHPVYAWHKDQGVGVWGYPDSLKVE